jgi:hypothetical protein
MQHTLEMKALTVNSMVSNGEVVFKPIALGTPVY